MRLGVLPVVVVALATRATVAGGKHGLGFGKCYEEALAPTSRGGGCALTSA